tara:strand:+ start:3490 stop:3771 length:282 start_codon:yes stop_codon:yes gene_type:complete
MSEPTNVTAPIAQKDKPLGGVIKRYKAFTVPSSTFRKFETGRNKFERWSKYLDMKDSNQKAIHDYAKTKPNNTIILKDSTTGAMRSIRRRSQK